MSVFGESVTRPLDKRLNERIAELPNGCWEWTGKRQPNGYARISVNGRQQLVHRVMYERIVGPIPEGLVIDHLCRNRACVRPGHLEPVTIAENLIRGDSNAHKTHCPQGHPYSGDNLYVENAGKAWAKRRCRTCKRDQTARRRNGR